MREAVIGLHQNQLFRVLITHLIERRDKRIMAAIKAKTDVEPLRGRAQEMIEIIEDLERQDG
jgi:hypothetical protein